ncbi:hypothetical protein [Streptomyces sp. NPDC001415]
MAVKVARTPVVVGPHVQFSFWRCSERSVLGIPSFCAYFGPAVVDGGGAADGWDGAAFEELVGHVQAEVPADGDLGGPVAVLDGVVQGQPGPGVRGREVGLYGSGETVTRLAEQAANVRYIVVKEATRPTGP